MPVDSVSFSFRSLITLFGYLQQVGNLSAIITSIVFMNQLSEYSSVMILGYITIFHSILQSGHFTYHSVKSQSASQAEHKFTKLHLIAGGIHVIPLAYGAASTSLQYNSSSVLFSYVWTWLHLAMFVTSGMSSIANSCVSGSDISIV